MKQRAIEVLDSQGFLMDNFVFDLREHFTSFLFQTANKIFQDKDHNYSNVDDFAHEVAGNLYALHQTTVNKEKERARVEKEQKRLAQEKFDRERAKRREFRRKKKLFLAKTELKEKVEQQIVEPAKTFEDPFAIEISDIYPIGKDMIGTPGGLIGEIWIVLATLRELYPTSLEIT